MLQQIMDRVNSFSERMLLHYAAPNRDLIVEIMQYDANQYAAMLDEDLSKYILVLGQYLVMLQHNDNLKNVEQALMAKAFDYELNIQKLSVEIPSGIKTEKDKKSWLVSNNAKLQGMEIDLLSAEAEATIISGMSKAVEALLNALKKEKSGRAGSE